MRHRKSLDSPINATLETSNIHPEEGPLMAMLQEQIHSVNSLHWYPPSPPRPIAPIIDKAAHGGSGYEKGMLAGDFALFKPVRLLWPVNWCNCLHFMPHHWILQWGHMHDHFIQSAVNCTTNLVFRSA